MPLSLLDRTTLFEQSGMIVLNQHLKITRNLACGSGIYRAVMTLGNQFTRSIRLFRGDERLPLVTMEERPRTRSMTMTSALEAAGVPTIDATYLTGMMKAINERPLRFPVPHTVMIRSADSITVINPACTIRRAAAIRAMVRRTGLPIAMVLNSHYHPDHWGNNGRIDSRESPILLHPMARAYLGTNYYVFMYRYCAGLFRDFDLADVYRRLLGMPRGAAAALDRIHGRTPAVMNSLLMLFNLKFTGWDLDSGLIALETPGHSPDHLSFYHRESGFLYIADIDMYVHVLLKELGYATVGTRGRAWQKVRGGALQQLARRTAVNDSPSRRPRS